MIRKVEPKDAAAIAEIYNYYIEHTIITFETSPVNVREMKERISEITGDGFPWLVFEGNGQVLGYAYANKWRGRCAYRDSIESTVYLNPSEISKGVGKQLYAELIKILKAEGFHTVIGGIALPNDASIALHEKLGFQKVAHFKEVGNKFDHRIDVGYWQLMLS